MDKVGYGRPPKHTRWKKGHSGNPSGRPKSAADFTSDVLAELKEVIQVNEGGKVKRITKRRALIKALTTGGIKGDTRASNILIALCARVLEADTTNGASPSPSAHDREIVEAYLEREIAARIAQMKDGKP
jgi:hypothetical protein